MNSQCLKVFIFALCNLLVVYYVVNNVHFENEKKFVSNFHSRLPKVSNQLDTEKPENIPEDSSINTGGSENPEHDLVNSMKNILIQQNKSELNQEITTKEAATIDQELLAKLLDSSEIELFTIKPVTYENPKLELDLPKLNTMTDFKKLMQDRFNRLKSSCERRNSQLSVVNSNYLYVLKSKSLVWCPVYKAASTNWMHNLIHLGGKSEKEVEEIIKKYPNQPNEQAREVAPLQSGSSVRSLVVRGGALVTTLLIVRHPFDRLVSAFRDKLEQCHGVPDNCTLSSNWYYKQYGYKIVSQYRKQARAKFGEQFFEKKNNYGAPFPVNRSWRDEHYPSWWEFIQYLLNTSPGSYDEHWKPASLYCSVCSKSLEYNHILHFENIETEESYLAKTLAAEDLIHQRWENKNTKDNISKEEILGKYFSLLTDQEIMKLYKIYEDDFRNFGYKFNFRSLKLS